MTPEIDLSKTYFGEDQDYIFNEIQVALATALGETETPDTTEVTVLGKDSAGNVTNAKGTTVPVAGEAGYALECAFTDSDKAAGTNKLYRNIGTAAVCNFQLVGDTALVQTVSSVAGLEAAVAAQTAGQTIRVMTGDYVLTDTLTLLLAASGGTLEAIGEVSITGAVGEDQAILVDPAVAAGTFSYTFKGFDGIKGGADKIGVNVANTNIAKKIILEFKDCYLEDNGTGAAVQGINTDGSNAIRMYFTGGAIDSLDFTPKDNGDQLKFRDLSIYEDMDVTAVDITGEFEFRNCKLPHAGIGGGHANNVCNVISCFTIETAAAAAADANDFPDAFAPTLVAFD